MAGQPPVSSILPWAWVLEALANFKEVDVTTLINMFNRSPKITNNVGSNARELVSFRILERLFDLDNQHTKSVDCAQKSGVSFDFSKRCEDVLQHILGRVDEPNIWDESEKSKWNVRSFIAYKRSCLLKSDLSRLKDTLIEGKTSYLTPLKQSITSLQFDQHGTKQRDVNGGVINNQQSSCIDDKVCQNTSNERNRKGEDGDNVKQSNESELLSDDEWYKKELNDIIAKKQVFFSSNCKEKEGVTHFKDVNRCMKCNKGGRLLLVCSSDNCSFVFHDSCLVSTTPFDYNPSGKFYCLFCRYFQSISDYLVVTKKAALARNHLASFNKRNNSNVESQLPNGALNHDLINESSESNGRFKKQKKPCTNLNVPLRRRVAVPWTQSEEETLKKWVDKLTSDSGIIEWRKILKLGASKFQKGRTPVDLKDKWRNMQKASKKST